MTITPRLASCVPPTVAAPALAYPTDPLGPELPDLEPPDLDRPEPEPPEPELEPPDPELPELACPAPAPGAGECSGRGPARAMSPAGAAPADAAPAAGAALAGAALACAALAGAALAGAALACAALACAAPDSATVAATAAHRHAAAAPVSRCRRAASRCALPKNSRMTNYV